MKHNIIAQKCLKRIFVFAACAAFTVALTACGMQSNRQNTQDAQLGATPGTNDNMVTEDIARNQRIGLSGALSQLNLGNVANQSALPLGLYNASSDSKGCSLALGDNNTCSLSYVNDDGKTVCYNGPATISGDKIVINDSATGQQVSCDYKLEGNSCKLGINGKTYTCQKR